MKYILDLAKLLPDALNSKIVWFYILCYVGIKAIIYLLYLNDWILRGGLRSDLLLLLDKM